MADSNEKKKGGFGAFEDRYRERWDATRHPASNEEKQASKAPPTPPAAGEPTDEGDPDAER